jgi:hypothetical protein
VPRAAGGDEATVGADEVVPVLLEGQPRGLEGRVRPQDHRLRSWQRSVALKQCAQLSIKQLCKL